MSPLPAPARRRPQSVQVFLVAQTQGTRTYLLFHRVAMTRLALPAFWQGISGALEAGESFAQAALREVREETGLTLSNVHSAGFSHRYPIRPEWRASYGEGPSEVEEQVFFAFVEAGTPPVLSHEHQAWRWCSLQEAEALLDFGQNRACLRAVDAAAAVAGVAH